MIAIIDYGMGNIHSVQKALEKMQAQVLVTNRPEDLDNCEKIVLPGVGAFDDAVIELEKKGLDIKIKQLIKDGKIFLGICLGMQLLFEKSAEGKLKGLGVFKGEVKKFKASIALKVPHMGWNQLSAISRQPLACALLKGIENNSYVYFCHSYYADPEDKKINAALTDYGIEFSSVLCRDNLFAVQFHPEKSQESGLKILRNFVDL